MSGTMAIVSLCTFLCVSLVHIGLHFYLYIPRSGIFGSYFIVDVSL